MIKEALPSIEEVAAKIRITKPNDEKTAGQSKEIGDVEQIHVDPEEDKELLDHMPGPTLDSPLVGTDVAEKDSDVVETPPPPPPVKDPQAAKFAALARREKEYREQRAEIERQRAKLDEDARMFEERQKAISEARRPSDVLKAHGLTYQQVTEDVLGVYKEPEKDPIEAKLEERLSPFMKELETAKKELEEQRAYITNLEKERVNNLQRDIDSQIMSTAKESACEYMLAAGEEAVHLTRNLIQEYWNKNKKILSYAEACDKVETYYSNRLKSFYETPKARSQFASTTATPSTQSPSKAPEAKERPSTLTNSLSQGARASIDVDKLPKHEALDYLARKLKYTNS